MTNSISNIESTILTDSKIYEYITNYTSSFMSLYNSILLSYLTKKKIYQTFKNLIPIMLKNSTLLKILH